MKAEILSNLGDGLYRIKLLPETKSIAQEASVTNDDDRRYFLNDVLRGFNASDEVEAWCADLTTSLEAGDVVGITDMLPHIPANVQPGWESGAIYKAGRDGEGVLIAGAEAYKLIAYLMYYPWWLIHYQKYRNGVISDIDYQEDLATFTEDAIQSRVEYFGATYNVLKRATAGQLLVEGDALNVGSDGAGIFYQVPIDYMNCNATAFAEDDRVVCEFSKDGTQKIIGFESHPKACDFIGFVCRPISDAAQYGWGEPFDPLPGYEGGPNPYVKFNTPGLDKIKRGLSESNGLQIADTIEDDDGVVHLLSVSLNGGPYLSIDDVKIDFSAVHGFFVYAAKWFNADNIILTSYESSVYRYTVSTETLVLLHSFTSPADGLGGHHSIIVNKGRDIAIFRTDFEEIAYAGNFTSNVWYIRYFVATIGDDYSINVLDNSDFSHSRFDTEIIEDDLLYQAWLFEAEYTYTAEWSGAAWIRKKINISLDTIRDSKWFWIETYYLYQADPSLCNSIYLARKEYKSEFAQTVTYDGDDIYVCGGVQSIAYTNSTGGSAYCSPSFLNPCPFTPYCSSPYRPPGFRVEDQHVDYFDVEPTVDNKFFLFNPDAPEYGVFDNIARSWTFKGVTRNQTDPNISVSPTVTMTAPWNFSTMINATPYLLEYATVSGESFLSCRPYADMSVMTPFNVMKNLSTYETEQGYYGDNLRYTQIVVNKGD